MTLLKLLLRILANPVLEAAALLTKLILLILL
jgi:hypothetical protein